MIAPRKSSAMLERARQSTQDGREQAARELLEWEKVEGTIREAAGKGFDHVNLAPALPINIRDTKTGQAAMERLTRLGFSARWDSRPGPEPGSHCYVLSISWTT